jgi:hypothetical protein
MFVVAPPRREPSTVWKVRAYKLFDLVERHHEALDIGGLGGKVRGQADVAERPSLLLRGRHYASVESGRLRG